MKQIVKYLGIVFVILFWSCSRYWYIDSTGKGNYIRLASEKRKVHQSYVGFMEKNVNRYSKCVDSMQIECITARDIRHITRYHDATFVIPWNTGCPYSNHVAFKTIKTIRESFENSLSVAIMLVSVNDNKIIDNLVQNNYHHQAYYFSDSSSLLSYKEKHLVNSLNPDSSLYRKYYDDVSLIGLIVFDKDFKIIYYRTPDYYSNRTHKIAGEIDSIRAILHSK